MKLSPLHILKSIFSRSLKSFEGHLLSIPELNKLYLLLVTCFRFSLENIYRRLNKACLHKWIIFAGNLIIYKVTTNLYVLIIFNSLQKLVSFMRLGFYSFIPVKFSFKIYNSWIEALLVQIINVVDRETGNFPFIVPHCRISPFLVWVSLSKYLKLNKVSKEKETRHTFLSQSLLAWIDLR